MLHLFWFCPYVNMFWMDLEKCLTLNSLVSSLCPQTIIFGELSNGCPNVLNTVISQLFHLFHFTFIFELKGKEFLTFFNFLSFLKHYCKLEGIIANTQQKIKDYERKWNTLRLWLKDWGWWIVFFFFFFANSVLVCFLFFLILYVTCERCLFAFCVLVICIYCFNVIIIKKSKIGKNLVSSFCLSCVQTNQQNSQPVTIMAWGCLSWWSW